MEEELTQQALKVKKCTYCGKYVFNTEYFSHYRARHETFEFNYGYEGEKEDATAPPKHRRLTKREQGLMAFATQDVSPNERDNAREMLRRKGLWND